MPNHSLELTPLARRNWAWSLIGITRVDKCTEMCQQFENGQAPTDLAQNRRASYTADQRRCVLMPIRILTKLSAERKRMEPKRAALIVVVLSILIVVLAFNLFGEGLRDILNPKLRERY